jgi:hypothetical protein
VEESTIEQPKSLVQTRVRIDPFTGGALETGLFSEQPVFGQASTAVNIDMCLQFPANKDEESSAKQEIHSTEEQLSEGQKSQAALLVLCLKDLWTEDLPLGGESSCGRGRLQGCHAQLQLKLPGQAPETLLTLENGTEENKLTLSPKETVPMLERWVENLPRWIGRS